MAGHLAWLAVLLKHKFIMFEFQYNDAMKLLYIVALTVKVGIW